MSGLNPLQLFSAGFVLLLAVASPSHAQGLFSPPTGNSPAAAQLFTVKGQGPDISSVPALSNLVKNGGKLYYMGERSSIHGWLIVKDSQVQMVYLSPDRQTVIVGGMFSSNWDNVTSPQIEALMEANVDVRTLLNNTAQQQNEVVQAGGTQGGATSVPGNASAHRDSSDQMPAAVPLSPGERLVQDLKAAAGVVLGQNDGAEILMLVAPGCPNCKSTWKELREAVFAKKLQVRLIPVYNSTGTMEKTAAAQLLRVQNPLDAWDRYVNGDAAALVGAPDSAAMNAIDANLKIVAKWNIQGYPYLVYRGNDGRVKIVQGKPERMAAVLADLSR